MKSIKIDNVAFSDWLNTIQLHEILNETYENSLINLLSLSPQQLEYLLGDPNKQYLDPTIIERNNFHYKQKFYNET